MAAISHTFVYWISNLKNSPSIVEATKLNGLALPDLINRKN